MVTILSSYASACIPAIFAFSFGMDKTLAYIVAAQRRILAIVYVTVSVAASDKVLRGKGERFFIHYSPFSLVS